jgi:hypothetical protein
MVAVEVGDDHRIDRIAVESSGGKIGVELADDAVLLRVEIGPQPSVDDDSLLLFTTIGV